jgi:hypothetical protein
MNFTPALQVVSYVPLVCMVVVLVVSMLRLATHHFQYHLLSSHCANLIFSVDKSFQAWCVPFGFDVVSIFEEYVTVLGSHLQQV